MGIGAKLGIFAASGASAFSNISSIDLDGTDDYMNCGALNSIIGVNAWSVSAWVNRDTGTATQIIINLKENSYHGHDFQIFHNENLTRIDVNVNGANAFRNTSVIQLKVQMLINVKYI